MRISNELFYKKKNKILYTAPIIKKCIAIQRKKIIEKKNR